ncbi:MAG TPA: hypothetical protein VHS58_16455, partial [Acetobacteraceae bacterium]|nr:hypothetical protein [Acetobacteraceae bacterium]
MSDVPADRYERESPRDRREEPEGFLARINRWISGHPQRRGLRRPEGQKPSPPEVRAHFWYWIVAFGALMLFQAWWIRHQTVEPVSYSQFLTLLQDHKVKS